MLVPESRVTGDDLRVHLQAPLQVSQDACPSFLAWTWPLSHSTAQQQRDYLLKIGLLPTDPVLSLPHDLSPSTLGA